MLNLLSGTALLRWRPIRMLRRASRQLLRPHRLDGPLSKEAALVEFQVLNPPLMVAVKLVTEVRLRINNLAGIPLTSRGSHPVQLHYTWQPLTKARYPEATTPVALPDTLYPGEPVEFRLPIIAPPSVGDFRLGFALIQPDLGSFELRGTHHFAVQVNFPHERDIDYHAVFRNANLQDNYWWVVGAYHSREAYEKSARERHSMLTQELGVTPDERVLDVGCGTGQIAIGLEGYLSDRGAYYGTDLAQQAIDFCRGEFKRPNFVFRVNAMTSLPIEDHEGPFDTVLFFSVFTHTHIDESILLLGEAMRLLSPGGQIIADFLSSALVERGLGNRGEMHLNGDYFLRMAGLLGLKAEVFARWKWAEHVERLLMRFTQR